MVKQKSEFGKGCAYCLGLFLSHQWQFSGIDYMSVGSWFNAASDHLFELQPTGFVGAEKLDKRILSFRKKCLSWGHSFGFRLDGSEPATKEDKEWALQEAKELLRLIDGLLKIKTIEASWK